MTNLSTLFGGGTPIPLEFTADGEMTNPSQPCFASLLDTQQNNVTGDGTLYSITGAFWTDIFDIGNNFSNGTFTAPVTGKYILSITVDVIGLVSGQTRFLMRIVTSNRQYELFEANSYNVSTSSDAVKISGSYVVDMDANDTAYIDIKSSGGSKVVDVRVDTQFNGALIF